MPRISQVRVWEVEHVADFRHCRSRDTLTCHFLRRWLIQKDKIDKAYRSFRRIRNTDVQAARDTYYTYVGVQLEKKINKNKNLFIQFYELFSVPRNRRATWATVSYSFTFQDPSNQANVFDM